MSDPHGDSAASAGPSSPSRARSRRRRRKPRAHSDGPSLEQQSRGRLEFPDLLERVSKLASSAPGRREILTLEPLGSIEAMEAAQTETDEARSLLRTRFSFRLDQLEDIDRLLPPLDGEGRRSELTRVFTGKELYSVGVVLERSVALGRDLRARADLPALSDRGQRLGDRPELREAIERSVDARGSVLDDATPGLRAIRESLKTIESELRRWLEKKLEAREFRKALQENLITQRNGRFVVPIKAEQRGQVRGVVHAESSSGATLFIEPEAIVLRGDELDTLRRRESHEVNRILVDLTQAVRRDRDFISSMFRELVELDVTVARARFGERFGAVRPTWSRDRRFVLEDARHPLLMDFAEKPKQGYAAVDEELEAMKAAVEPLSFELSASCYQMVVTGPNTGGKTVVLKTAGLMVLMASVGLPVTAQRAELPGVRSVFADIGDEQSLEQSLSTFSSHMTVISQILEQCNSHTLVLLDELGAGTDPLEGAALGQAILEQLYRRGTFALVTTHLGRLKEFAFTHRKCMNACMEFDAEKLAPTYRLLPGLPGKSNALVIAERIGLAGPVVERAHEVLSGEDRIDQKVLEGLERTQRDLDRRRQEVRAQQKDAARTEEKLSEEREAVHRMRRGIEHEAERSEEERVDRLVHDLTLALKDFGEPPAERRAAYDRIRSLLGEARQRTQLGERRQLTAEKLKKGEWVFVPRLAQVCAVKKINKGRRLLTVAHGPLSVEVSFDDISWTLPPPGYDLEWYS